MAKAWGVGRRVLIGLGAVAAVVIVLRVGAGLYLHTASGRAVVAERLGAAIGLPVEVRQLDVGAVSSSIGFRVLDPALPTSPEAEVLVVESASADVSFAELVTGRVRPKEVRLRGVAVALRLDASGKLLTTLPTLPEGQAGGGDMPVPLVVVETARLTIRQEGRPAFTVSGVTLRAEPNGNKVVLSGSGDDPNWGKWKLSGEVDRSAQTGWVDVATDDAPLNLDLLRSLPYIPHEVWDNAQPAGRGKAVVHLTVGPGPQHDVGYDVRVQPVGAATLGLPAAEVTLQEVNGLVRIHDGKVDVGGADGRPTATGKLAGGEARLAGRYDFTPEPSVADPITVSVDRLAVKGLPAKWGLKNLGGKLPGKLSLEDGFLTGSAKLKLVIPAKGEVQVFGGGTGHVTLPNFLGGKGRIGVTLGGDGKRLDFNLGEATVAPPGANAGDAAPVGRVESSRPDAAPQVPDDVRGEREPTRVLVSELRRALIEPRVGSRRLDPTYESPTIPKADLDRLLLAAVLLQQPEPKRTDQTPVEATLSLRDIDVAQLITQLELKIPYKIDGKVTLRAKLGVPLGEATTAASYKLSGTLTSPELRFEGLTVKDAAAELNYQNGVLTLSELRGKVPQPGTDEPGEFRGTARAAIDPPGAATASLTLTKLPLGPVLAAVPDLGVSGAGTVSGTAEFRAPFDKLEDPATWVASAKLTSDTLTVAGRKATAVSFAAAVANGTLKLSDTAATIEGIPVTASGTLQLKDRFDYDATVKATGASVTDLRKLAPEAELPVPVEGALTAEAKLTGTLAPLTYRATGRVTAADLTLNKTPANHLDVRWELNPDRVQITELSAKMFGGSLDGRLDYPLKADRAGSFALGFKELDASAARAFVPDFPVRVTGAVTGRVSGTIPPAKDGQRVGDLDVDLSAPKLTVQGFPAERLVGKASLRGGALEYSLEGHTLGGTFDVKGRYPGKQNPPPKDGAKAGPGSVRVQNIDLSRLGAALHVDQLRPLAGRVDLTFDYENDLSAGSGRVSVRGLRWGDEATADDVSGVLLLRDGYFELRDLSGYIAGGVVRGRARVKVDDPARNFVSLTLDRADAKRLAAPFGEFEVVGNVSAVVRGNIGRSTRLTGTVSLDRGTVGGAALVGLRVPFEVTAGSAGGHLTVRELTAQAGAGRTAGGITVDWGGGPGVRVGGQVRLIDVPIRALAPGLGENAFVGTGRVTGRFDVSGQNVRSVDDLKGNLVAVLNGASVREIPLLRQAVPYLNPVGVTKAFQSGDVRATLAGGVVRVHRLALANPTAQVYADGSITLTNGRLDLDVVAHTGQIGPDVRALRLIGLGVPVLGPVPLTVVRDVSDFLSNRTVRLTIGGTVSSPAVRVNAGALLRDEAVRFFLSRYVLPAGVADAIGVGSVGGMRR